jgi:hypothetical protein
MWETGVVAQAVAHMLSKHEALSSKPSPTQKKKKVKNSMDVVRKY